ncbi:hypothetical protein [Spirulina subsalsa]
MGVTGKTVSNWERGISTASLTIPQLKALCTVLGQIVNREFCKPCRGF